MCRDKEHGDTLGAPDTQTLRGMLCERPARSRISVKYANTLSLRYERGSARRRTKAGRAMNGGAGGEESTSGGGNARMKSKRQCEVTVVVLVNKALFS